MTVTNRGSSAFVVSIWAELQANFVRRHADCGGATQVQAEQAWDELMDTLLPFRELTLEQLGEMATRAPAKLDPPLASSLLISVLPSVLVVEDSQIVRTVLHHMLEDDYEVISTSTVGKAFVVLMTRHVDVVLLEYSFLGGSNKKDATEWTGNSGTPFLCMSGDHTLADSRCTIVGKPFNYQKVLDALLEARTRT